MSYVFAPTENGEKKNERNLRKIIEYIGSKQSGIGSNTSKGLRYIKTQLSCTRAYLKTQKSCIIQTKAKWKQRVRKQETMKQAYHNEQQLCEKL